MCGCWGGVTFEFCPGVGRCNLRVLSDEQSCIHCWVDGEVQPLSSAPLSLHNCCALAYSPLRNAMSTSLAFGVRGFYLVTRLVDLHHALCSILLPCERGHTFFHAWIACCVSPRLECAFPSCRTAILSCEPFWVRPAYWPFGAFALLSTNNCILTYRFCKGGRASRPTRID